MCRSYIFLIQSASDQKKQGLETFCAFIDFQKAFNLVDHKFLMYKLGNIGILGCVYMAIKAMYRCPMSCVNVSGRLTDWFRVGSEVRQGDSVAHLILSFCQ